jgi:inhibitor of KinA
MPGILFYPLSERALTIEFGKEISIKTHEQIMQADFLVRRMNLRGFIETVPANNTLTIYYDPLLILEHNAQGASSAFEIMKSFLSDLIQQPSANLPLDFPLIQIPVCYSPQFGQDLDFVSKHSHLPTEEIIQLHTSSLYTVFMIGFSPGFPYLGILPEKLEVPRKSNPDSNLPAGSVAIAGRQTGIYPFETPGGWQVIGRTPLRLFDTGRSENSLLKTGYRVQFVSITPSQFEQFQQP